MGARDDDMASRLRISRIGLLALPLTLAGCAGSMLSDRECMTRAMYFESNRSSTDGMVAVGTTVMNRLETPGFPKTVCGVVGQPRQYAPGVLTKPMNERQAARIATVADAVLAGERHPQVGSAMFFHTAGLTFPYTNMHYVAVAGGNAFYEKRPAGSWTPEAVPIYDPTGAGSRAAAPAASQRSVAFARDGGRAQSLDGMLRDSAAPPTTLSREVIKVFTGRG